MIVTLMNAAAKEIVSLDLEFGPNQWWVAGAAPTAWTNAGRPKSGHFAPGVKGGQTILLRDNSAAGLPFLSLSRMKPYESASMRAGSGTFLKHGQPTDERILWSRKARAKLSPIRQKILQYLKDKVPKTGLYSNHPNFKEITGFTTESLQTFWEGDPGFTTCNSFAGGVAQKIGTPAGRLLNKGYLELDKLGAEVPGSWIPAKPNHYPRPGDYYSRPSRKYKTQLMGHVGIVMSVDPQFVSIDGGQDNKPHYGLAEWTENGAVEGFNFTGWIDLDVYFYGTAIPRKKITGG